MPECPPCAKSVLAKALWIHSYPLLLCPDMTWHDSWRTEKVVTLCGSVCRRPSSRGLVEPVAAGAAALAVLDGTAIENAVGSIVGALGKAGAALSSSKSSWSGRSHCHTYPSSLTAMTRSDSEGGGTSTVWIAAVYRDIPGPPLASSPSDKLFDKLCRSCEGVPPRSKGDTVCSTGRFAKDGMRWSKPNCDGEGDARKVDCPGLDADAKPPLNKRSSKELRGADTELLGWLAVVEKTLVGARGVESSDRDVGPQHVSGGAVENVSDFAGDFSADPGGRGGLSELCRRNMPERPGEPYTGGGFSPPPLPGGPCSPPEGCDSRLLRGEIPPYPPPPVEEAAGDKRTG